MIMSLDLTGIALVFAGLGVTAGLVFGFFGQRWLIVVVLIAAIAALFWFNHITGQPTGRAAIGQAVITLGCAWSLFVMLVTYALVRMRRRQQTGLQKDGHHDDRP
jgi:hypothetical protein